MAPQPPDPAQVADAVARYRASRALREFRARLYGCLTARADACFGLTDAILCADHAVTSLVQLSLVPESRRGHGALYDALAAGRIDEEKLAVLLTGTLPQLAGGEQGRALIAEHDRIGYGLLEAALAGVPAEAAAQVRDACARWRRPRFAVGATPYPRPDAGCSPGRGHVHHDACRCDGTRKTVLAAALWSLASAVPSASAGTRPAARIDPGAIAAAARHGLPLRRLLSRRIGDIRADGDLVIPFCDSAHETLRGQADLHWSVPDPVAVGGDAAFDSALDELARRVDDLAPRVTPI
jgi:protein-tyrosine-phosphatase